MIGLKMAEVLQGVGKGTTKSMHLLLTILPFFNVLNSIITNSGSIKIICVYWYVKDIVLCTVAFSRDCFFQWISCLHL